MKIFVLLTALSLLTLSRVSYAAQYVQSSILMSCSMASTCTSIGVDLNQMNLASIEAVFTGSPVGTLGLQISSDDVPLCNTGSANCVTYNPAGNVVNWVTYTGSSEAVTSSGNFLWNLNLAGYRWIRLVYIPTSGTGSLSATYDAKSYTN
jgi:hypothetical protein